MSNLLQMGAYQSAQELQSAGFRLQSVAQRQEPSRILMCAPDFFEIKDSKNPFMDGNLNGADTELARRQWQALKQTYDGLGYGVQVLDPVPGLEDMVFTANQVLPGISAAGQPFVVPAKMVHASRRQEVPHFVRWFVDQGYEVRELDDCGQDEGPRFEGQGDAVWHPHRQLLWGGFGFRTEEAAYEGLAARIDAAILKLRLVNPRFYHLDTAFCALDEQTAMIYAPAFASESLALIRHVFSNVIEVSEADANNFVCNATALGKHVVLQKGSAAVCAQLKKLGYTPAEVDTSEFMKSGGSVFCLKMQVY